MNYEYLLREFILIVKIFILLLFSIFILILSKKIPSLHYSNIKCANLFYIINNIISF